MRNKQIAWMPISNELLIEVLHLPEDTEIIGAEIDWKINPPVVRLLVTNPALNDVEDGDIVPEIMPTFERSIGPSNAARIFEVKMTKWGQREE
jgi:hypothetical protein